MKLAALLNRIDQFEPFRNADRKYERFLVPCSSGFINSKKINPKIKTAFFRKWIETTEKFILKKPGGLEFCKIVCVINVPNLWSSQIIIFYDRDYFNEFWNRKSPEQIWIRIADKKMSLMHELGIDTSMKEIGYREEISDGDYDSKSILWFYGEL